jgi:SAM-dependent methyltransferase
VSYDKSFFEYVDDTAIRSARVVVPLVLAALPCRSVLDVGCGRGAWLSEYRRHGVGDVLGLDGNYVATEMLAIPSDHFKAVDLERGFDVHRRFDLVQSLEVAEHLLPASSDVFVESLTRHGALVLFSAAVPGQGGENHVNEQPYERWRARFASRGFAPYDFLRSQLREKEDVAPWYACNSVLYVHEGAASSLPSSIRETRVPDSAPIADVWPASYRLRRMVLRSLPVSIVSQLSRLNRRLLHKRPA